MASLDVDGRKVDVSRLISLLELFHPDGTASRRWTLGGEFPDPIFAKARTEPADLVVVSPSVEECRSISGLEELVQAAAANIAPDGILYVLAPTRYRNRVRRVVTKNGFLAESAILHLPFWRESQHLIPLTYSVLAHALLAITPVARWKRQILLTMFKLPFSFNLLDAFMPGVGFLARRPASRPSMEWLCTLGEGRYVLNRTVLSVGWRDGYHDVRLSLFLQDGEQPAAFAKLRPCNDRGDGLHEATMLSALGPTVRRAGAHLPEALGVTRLGSCAVVLQSAVQGRLAVDLLLERPDRISDMLSNVVEWLERWNRLTLVHVPFDQSRMEQEFLAPLEMLVSELEHGEAYRTWLMSRVERAIGIEMPWVAVHRDLTMWNVLFDDDDGLAVIDWEEGDEQGWPLSDFFYMVANAVRLVTSEWNVAAACMSCFAPGGEYYALVKRFQDRLVQALDIDSEIAELCFHGCWLHHAANEQRMSRAGDGHPFREVVAWVTSTLPQQCK